MKAVVLGAAGIVALPCLRDRSDSLTIYRWYWPAVIASPEGQPCCDRGKVIDMHPAQMVNDISYAALPL
jgi:hypothetical protein